MAGEICDVCGGQAVGVASSMLGAVSFAYCHNCIREGAEPYDMLLVTMWIVGAKTLDDCAGWFKGTVKDSLRVANKTLDEFNEDYKKFSEESDKELLMFEMAENMDDDDLFDDDGYLFDEDDTFFK